MTPTTDKVALKLTADSTFWPTATEAIDEVRSMLKKDKDAMLEGEDGVVRAELALELLQEFAAKDPSRKIRPLGWTKLTPRTAITVPDTSALAKLPVTRKSSGCKKSCGGKGCC